MSDENKKQDLSILLSNYISVWLWSILLGATTTLTYQVAGYSRFDKWGELSVVLAGITFASIMILMFTWKYLLRYLERIIIPLVIKREDPLANDETKEEASFILSRAYKYLIYAAMLSLSKTVFQHLFQALSF